MAITSRTDSRLQRAGIGLRLPHIAEVVATRPDVGWLEVHPENFLANPHATELLSDLAHDYPISVHTVGISIGSADGIDRAHLDRLAAFIDAVNPVLVSGHLAWSTFEGRYLNDLLPLPYTKETLRLVAGQLAEVQDRLGRPYLIENPSTYIGFSHSTMTEVEFLNELVSATGCRLLCDVSNVFVTGHNMNFDPHAYLEAFPAGTVDEVHLGGFTPEDDEATPGATVLIDTHATAVAGPVWPLYAKTLELFGRTPTLIEWDNDLPVLRDLVAEAHEADAIGHICEGVHADR
ncbi:MAG: MNIO family bufferin maturase [Vicinamibacterales bacterium]